MKNLFFLLIFISTALWGQSQEVRKYGIDTAFEVPKGLAVGNIAPVFSTRDVEGRLVTLEQLTQQGPVVILFYRGQWCPVCSNYLNNFNDSISLIRERGATVIAISPETQQNAEKTRQGTNSNFSFIADTSLGILRSYDVLFNVTGKYQAMIKNFLRTDIAKNNGRTEAMLPVPATYIVNGDGKITFKQFDYNYKKRASVKSILDHL